MSTTGFITKWEGPTDLIEIMQKWRQPKPTKQRQRSGYARGLKTSAAAEYLGVSGWKLRQLVYTKEIPVIRGRHFVFDVKDLDAYIERTKQKGA